MAQRWSWLPLYSAYRKASRKFLAVITAGISLRSAGSQAGMMTWTLLPNGGHVTRCEAVWAKREEDGPATPPAPAGLAASGWKAGGGTEPHATTSAPAPASKAPRGARHIRRPPLIGCYGQRGTLPTAASRSAGPAEPTGPAGEVTRPAGEPVTPAGELLARRRENFWPAGRRTSGPPAGELLARRRGLLAP